MYKYGSMNTKALQLGVLESTLFSNLPLLLTLERGIHCLPFKSRLSLHQGKRAAAHHTYCMQHAKQTSYLWVPSSPAQFGMFCRVLSKPSMTCQHLGTMVTLLILLMLVQLMVHVLWVLTYLFFAELAPPHRAYTSSQCLCSSACHSHLLWTGWTLGYLWHCLLTRCLGLCLIAAFLQVLAWG